MRQPAQFQTRRSRPDTAASLVNSQQPIPVAVGTDAQWWADYFNVIAAQSIGKSAGDGTPRILNTVACQQLELHYGICLGQIEMKSIRREVSLRVEHIFSRFVCRGMTGHRFPLAHGVEPGVAIFGDGTGELCALR